MHYGVLVPAFWRGIPHTEDGVKKDNMKVDIWTLLVLNMGEIGSMYMRKFVRKYLKEGIDEYRRIIRVIK